MIPYTTNAAGKGPAWMNPLFEDNSEFGYGMYIGSKKIRSKIADRMRQWLKNASDENVKQAFYEWLG